MEPVFYCDTNSNFAYLASTRVDRMLGENTVWQPVALAFIHRYHDRIPWSMKPDERPGGLVEADRRLIDYGLPPSKLPPEWPVGSYSLLPLQMALAAKREGAVKEFTRAAFARHFIEGLPMTTPADVDAVAAAAGLDGPALRAVDTSAELKAETKAALEAGIYGVPSFYVGGQMFWGDDQLEEAAKHA